MFVLSFYSRPSRQCNHLLFKTLSYVQPHGRVVPERISHECEFTEHTTHEYKFYHTDILQNQIAFSPKQKKLKVNNELIIDVQENEVKIALLEDKKLASYHSENRESENKYAVANI